MINIIPSQKGTMYEGEPCVDVLKKLEEAGADVVGFNCSFGPSTIVDLTEKARAVCKV